VATYREQGRDDEPDGGRRSKLRAVDGGAVGGRRLPTDPELRAIELRRLAQEIERGDLELRQLAVRVEREENELSRDLIDADSAASDLALHDWRNTLRMFRAVLALLFVTALTLVGTLDVLSGDIPFERSIHALITEVGDLLDQPSSSPRDAA
jgi:hypothetical protein